jgi:hypothetical protein
VHVLDLALFLPAVVTSGVQLLRRRPSGYATVVGQLVLLGLTCLPIVVTPFVAYARGHEPGWTVLFPIGVVLVALLGVLGATLRQVSGSGGSPHPGAPGRGVGGAA